MVRQDATVVVVGAGVGGLACAIDLASRGARVQVFERAPGPGGKAGLERVGGARVDAGPTVLTMPWVFDELFDASGGSFRSEVSLERAAVLARHAWADGTVLDLHADRDRSTQAIGDAFGAREARAYAGFCADARRIFETVETPFLRSQRPTILGTLRRAVGTTGLGALLRIDAFRSMWRALEDRFADPRLRQLFGRYATYCGSSPFEAPATLQLVAHVESEGVFRMAGGMSALGEALEVRARSLGVELTYDAHVDEVVVRGGRVSGVMAGGNHHQAEAVVFNGDVSALAAGLLGRDVARAATGTSHEARSLSAVTWAVVARADGFPLVHHNVFFSTDYPAEFEDIRAGRPPAAPTVYVCAQDRDDTATAPGDERMLVVVNAPPTGDDPARWAEFERNTCEHAMLRTLRSAGLTLTPSAAVQTTPADFHRRFPATGGALYGPIARGPLSALARQAATSRMPGLYLAGGSVHPGPGVPLAALSGRLAAERVRADLASTSRSRPVATAGTTSTA